MKIACFELNDWEKDYFKEKFKDTFEITFFDSPIQENDINTIKQFEIVVVFIYSKLTKETLDSLPNLKLISTMSTGFDHIDIEECKKRNILVSTVPAYGEITVAEHAFALIFAISRRLIESAQRVKEGNFSPEGLTGFDLFGKTLGVIGVGTIGCHVIRIAKGIGMDVLGYKRIPDEKLARELGFTFTDMDNLLSKSDVITIHLPYSQETHHFINKESFGKMKDGVVIVNTARGAILDTEALLNSLNSGKVLGAGLDVLEEEPILREEKELLSRHFDKEELVKTLENHILLNNEKVIITPHNAFNSKEALARILNTTQENVHGFISGNPKNLVF